GRRPPQPRPVPLTRARPQRPDRRHVLEPDVPAGSKRLAPRRATRDIKDQLSVSGGVVHVNVNRSASSHVAHQRTHESPTQACYGGYRRPRQVSGTTRRMRQVNGTTSDQLGRDTRELMLTVRPPSGEAETD